jgi:hypothetical protein
MPVKWYSSLVLICLLGVALIVYSRYERQHPPPATQPAIGAHWYQALGFDICGTFEPNLPLNPNASTAPVPGIRTEGDGVIQVVPTTAADTGNNATLARFVTSYPNLKVSSGLVQLPGKPRYTNSQKCPAGSSDAGKPGQVVIKMWPSFTPPGSNNPVVFHDPAAIKLADGQLITVAFVPSGATIPKPAKSITAMNTDREGSATPSTVPTATTPTTPTATTPTATTATTKPGSTATTASTLPSSKGTTPTTAKP